MLDNHTLGQYTFIRHELPDWVHIGTVKVTRAIPAPTPHYTSRQFMLGSRNDATHRAQDLAGTQFPGSLLR